MKALLLFLFVCVGCDSAHKTLAPSPAAKVATQSFSDQCNAVYWKCDPSTWNSRADSTFTVFYGPYGFQVHGDSVRVALYGYGEDENWLLRLYWASETNATNGKVLAGFRQSDTHCGIWTSALIDTASAVVYQGKVVHWNAGEPGSRYGLFEAGEPYAVAWVRQSGEIVPIDFLSYHHRDEPRPSRLTYSQNGLKGYYLPVNADLGAVGAQIERGSIRDIRPFLRSSVCVAGECPEWLDFSCTDVSSSPPRRNQGTSDSSDDEPDSEPPVAAAGGPSQEAAPPAAPQISAEPSSEPALPPSSEPARTGLTVQGVEVELSSEPSRTGLTVQGIEVRTDKQDNTQLYVVWTELPPSAGVTDYRVEYKEGTHPADPFTLSGTPKATALGRTMNTNKVTTEVQGLRPGTTYTVRVTALRNGTELGHGEATGRTRDALGPVVKAVPGYGDKLDVSWPGLGDGFSYTVKYRRTHTAEEFIEFTRADMSATTERITGLVHNTEYTVRVQARIFIESEVNPGYYVVGTAEATAITSFPQLQPPEPGAASGLSGWTLAGTGVSFDWKALDDVSGRNVTGYTIQWATDPNPTSSWTDADQSTLSEKRCIPNMTVANYGYMREDTGDQQWVGCLYQYGAGTGWNLGDVRYFRLIAHTEGGADSDPGPISKLRALP